MSDSGETQGTVRMSRSIAERQRDVARFEEVAMEMLRNALRDSVVTPTFLAGRRERAVFSRSCNPLSVIASPSITPECFMSQPVISITHEDHASSGRYVARLPGTQAEAELTWRTAGPGVIVADHTYAPPAMRGSGAAAALVDRLMQDARQKGLQIVPACSYVRAQFERHPEWSDLRAEV